MSRPATLLVIGIHREELAFGQAVAAELDPATVEVLAIPEGLSGRHPRADQRFHWDTLHRALYLQLRPHVHPHHRLLIDLHTGIDQAAPCADLYSRDPTRLAALLAHAQALAPPPRLITLGGTANAPGAQTVIPEVVWNDPDCLYVGMEIYLAEPGAGCVSERDYARALIAALADGDQGPGCVGSGM
jgi:hypothetical protein